MALSSAASLKAMSLALTMSAWNAGSLRALHSFHVCLSLPCGTFFQRYAPTWTQICPRPVHHGPPSPPQVRDAMKPFSFFLSWRATKFQSSLTFSGLENELLFLIVFSLHSAKRWVTVRFRRQSCGTATTRAAVSLTPTSARSRCVQPTRLCTPSSSCIYVCA